MSNLKLTTRDQDGITVLSCNGRVVFGDESSALRDMVKGLIAEGKSNIVINLGGVSYIDSGGLELWSRCSPRRVPRAATSSWRT